MDHRSNAKVLVLEGSATGAPTGAGPGRGSRGCTHTDPVRESAKTRGCKPSDLRLWVRRESAASRPGARARSILPEKERRSARQMVAAKLLRLWSASLHPIRRQRSAERGQQNDGRREAITASDTPLAERGARALLAWGRATGRWWQRSYIGCVQHHCSRAAASVAQSAARHMTAGARLSLRVTCRWRSAGRMPCSHGAGRQTDGGSEATMASLHTV